MRAVLNLSQTAAAAARRRVSPGLAANWLGYALMLVGWLVLSSLLVSPERIDRRIALDTRVRDTAPGMPLPMLPAARGSGPTAAETEAPPAPAAAAPVAEPAGTGMEAAPQGEEHPPAERWVQAFEPLELWSSTGPDAISFGTAGQWRYFRVVGEPVAGRLYVYVPETKNYAYVDAHAVGPSGPPPPPGTTRIVIPKINLDSKIVDVGIAPNGEMETPSFAAGRFRYSGQAGEMDNVVLAGHNDIAGEVFRHLDRLKSGDQFTLYRGDDAFEYVVSDVLIVREQGATAEQRRENAKVLLPTEEPVATLITCWPYLVDTHRLVVRAKLVQ